MNISERGLNLIKEFEGFYPKPYLCPAKVPTIGYGTTYYPNGKRVTLQDRAITQYEATELLRANLKGYEHSVNSLVRKVINQNQYDALVCFTYNVGATNFEKSTLLKKININPDDLSIGNEFYKWIYAGGKALSGLKRRRKAEANLYFSK